MISCAAMGSSSNAYSSVNAGFAYKAYKQVLKPLPSARGLDAECRITF
jgi:hypothetical protein